jgi:large subunit ribosomal protein L31
MKQGIHPNYNGDNVITCSSCGATYEIGSTKSDLSVAICAKCHPFYTGEQQVNVDSANKISSFKDKLDKAAELKKRKVEIEKARAEREKSKVGVIGNDTRMSLRDLLKANQEAKKTTK